jgi:H+-transporting ATPase
MERAERSKRSKSSGTTGPTGAPGQGSRKEAESEERQKQKSGAGGEADDDSTKEGDEDEDEDEGVDKGPSICSVDQSAITGESLAVDKFHGETVYYTTICKRGKCFARSKYIYY